MRAIWKSSSPRGWIPTAYDAVKKNEILLLEALSAALRGEGVSWEKGCVASWNALLRLARAHNVLPMVAQAVWDDPALREDAAIRALSRAARRLVIFQAQRTGDFHLLYRHLHEVGLNPVVMKGLVCRSLYPYPEQRPSVDEDLLIAPEDFSRYHETLLRLGFSLADPDIDPEAEHELAYVKPPSHLYLEVHKQAFLPDSESYGDCNVLFEEALNRTVSVQIDGMSFRTLAPTDHLLYLLCHAYKHFLHSGVGIRQVCDMGMFAEQFGAEVDWARIVRGCASIRIDRFAAALFRIAEQHLGFPLPEAFSAYDVDTGPLLEDILSGGLYGTVDEDRLHSGSITLDAVAAQKRGRKRRGILASLFPSVSSLSGRYPYLREKPWLLPAAWVQRIGGYLKKRKVSAAASVHAGEQRIELLKKYGIID